MTLLLNERLQMDEGHGQLRSSHSRSLSYMMQMKKSAAQRGRNGIMTVGAVGLTASLKMIWNVDDTS